MTHACNPSTLGSQSRRINSSLVWAIYKTLYESKVQKAGDVWLSVKAPVLCSPKVAMRGNVI